MALINEYLECTCGACYYWNDEHKSYERIIHEHNTPEIVNRLVATSREYTMMLPGYMELNGLEVQNPKDKDEKWREVTLCICSLCEFVFCVLICTEGKVESIDTHFYYPKTEDDSDE